MAKTKQAANLELSMQRHEFEDKLAELEKALVGLKTTVIFFGFLDTISSSILLGQK